MIRIATEKSPSVADALKTTRFIIMGNPNSGKTALFNRLTGRHHKISNFPGVTVERRTGLLKNRLIRVDDLPGAYSLNPRAYDEQLVASIVHSWREPENRPDGLLLVVDATNFHRTIYFVLQILEYGIPAILVINMIDAARRQKIQFDTEKLCTLLGCEAVVCTSAKSGEGMDHLLNQMDMLAQKAKPAYNNTPVLFSVTDEISSLQELVDLIGRKNSRLLLNPLIDAVRLVENDDYLRSIENYFSDRQVDELRKCLKGVRKSLHLHGIVYSTLESDLRYRFIDQELAPSIIQENAKQLDISEHIDRILTHPFWGFAIMFLILGFIFNAIFSWAEYPMSLIESALVKAAQFADQLLQDSILKSFIIDGIIAGVGNVVVFLPQILLLIFFLGILEDTGYMSRISFIADRIMNKFGLHGKSILPMLSGFACAIPATMATRTIENWQDRLKLIMIIPLMSCSARLPVYTLLIAAFIPPEKYFGVIGLQGIVLLVVYLLGFVTALLITTILKFRKRQQSGLQVIMEMPPYRRPLLRSLWWRMYDSGRLFLINAGSIILAVSVLLWFLASHPRSAGFPETPPVSESYIGMAGRYIEPAIRPLGFDWKIGVGLITSFAAREVIISTFATIYNIDTGGDEAIVPIKQAITADRYPDGRPVFTPLVALSLIVFFVYAAQCMSTFAIIKRETNSWKWPLIMVGYMNILAYLASLVVYQGGRILGVD